jgi:hypothetical protein
VFDDSLTRVSHAVVAGNGETHEIPLERLLLDTEDECFIVDRRRPAKTASDAASGEEP